MLRLLYVHEERIPDELRRLVQSYFNADEFAMDSMTYRTAGEEQKRKLAWAEVVLFAPGRYLSSDVLASGKSVKLMQLWSSGYDKFNLTATQKLGIPVANNGGANANSVAEHAVLLMLSVYKWLPDSHRRTTTGSWAGNSHGLDMFTLRGKRIGIVGFGKIGQSVARILKGFQANVSYFDIARLSPERAEDLAVAYLPFETLLEQSDIITLHLHANEWTNNIISAEAFPRMKRGSVLINVSRASLVDQRALYQALTDGTLHGAGLDVYPEEPTTADDPILTLHNVVATPHMAGSTRDAYASALSYALDNFRRVARGEEPLGIVGGG